MLSYFFKYFDGLKNLEQQIRVQNVYWIWPRYIEITANFPLWLKRIQLN